MAESKADVVSKLKDIVTCCVCFRLLDKPSTFTCLHTFCKACLDQMKPSSHNGEQGYVCPVCRHYSNLEDIKVDAFLLKDMLEVYDMVISNSGSKMCSKCKVEKATHRCLNCKDDMCVSCNEFHDRFELMKVHKCIEIDENASVLCIDKLVFCGEHKEKPIELHCKQCNVPVCVMCKVIKHDGHPCETIDDVLNRIIPTIKQHQDVLKQQLEKSQTTVEKITSRKLDIVQSIQRLKQVVQDAYDSKKSQLVTERDALQTEIEQTKQKKSQEVGKVVQHLENYILEQSQLASWIDGTLAHTAGACQLDKFENDLFPKVCPSDSSKGLNEKVLTVKGIDLAFRETKLDQTALLGTLKPNTSHQPLMTSTASKAASPDFLEFSEFDTNNTQFDEDVVIENLGNCIQSFCIVTENIWLMTTSSQIQIYSTAGYLVDKRQVSHVTLPKAIIGISAKQIAIAAYSGIHILGVEDETPSRIADGTCHSISHHKDKLFALDFNNREVVVYKPHTRNTRWSKEKVIQLVGGCLQKHAQQDTIQVCNDRIFVAVFNGNRIEEYTMHGELRTTFGSDCMQLKKSSLGSIKLCAAGSNGLVLLCSLDSGSVYILNPRDASIRKADIESTCEKTKFCMAGHGQSLWIRTKTTLRKFCKS